MKKVKRTREEEMEIGAITGMPIGERFRLNGSQQVSFLFFDDCVRVCVMTDEPTVLTPVPAQAPPFGSSSSSRANISHQIL